MRSSPCWPSPLKHAAHVVVDGQALAVTLVAAGKHGIQRCSARCGAPGCARPLILCPLHVTTARSGA